MTQNRYQKLSEPANAACHPHPSRRAADAASSGARTVHSCEALEPLWPRFEL